MIVKNLSEIHFDELLNCFLKSFENYYVKMPTDKNYYKKRWESSKVDFNLSYGMFDKDTLVGFIINAVDHRNGNLKAYNAGTGVLPTYRGKKIVKAIYKDAVSDLIHHGFSKCSLEVITKNTFAIKSYQSIGFKITKNFLCYDGAINLSKDPFVNLKETDYNHIDWDAMPNQELYSWDHQKETLKISTLKFYEVIVKDKIESYFVINPNTGYIAQFEILSNHKRAWENLFKGIQQISSTIRINNIDDRNKDKICFLNSIGIKNTVDQYEMELKL